MQLWLVACISKHLSNFFKLLDILFTFFMTNVFILRKDCKNFCTILEHSSILNQLFNHIWLLLNFNQVDIACLIKSWNFCNQSKIKQVALLRAIYNFCVCLNTLALILMHIYKTELKNIRLNFCFVLFSECFRWLLYLQSFIQYYVFSNIFPATYWSLILSNFLILIGYLPDRCINFFVKFLSWCLTLLLHQSLNWSCCLFFYFSLLWSVHTMLTYFNELKRDYILPLFWSRI
jgi:hypothetical protein